MGEERGHRKLTGFYPCIEYHIKKEGQERHKEEHIKIQN